MVLLEYNLNFFFFFPPYIENHSPISKFSSSHSSLIDITFSPYLGFHLFIDFFFIFIYFLMYMFFYHIVSNYASLTRNRYSSVKENNTRSISPNSKFRGSSPTNHTRLLSSGVKSRIVNTSSGRRIKQTKSGMIIHILFCNQLNFHIGAPIVNSAPLGVYTSSDKTIRSSSSSSSSSISPPSFFSSTHLNELSSDYDNSENKFFLPPINNRKNNKSCEIPLLRCLSPGRSRSIGLGDIGLM
jgi:hypothetical protein